MRWQLMGDWPVRQPLVPNGTVLEGNPPIIWNGQPLPMPPPLNATALDQDAALAMAMAYHEDLWHQLHFAPTVDREAVFATARHKKRWPNGMPSQSMSGPSSPPGITPVPPPAAPKKRSSAAKG